MEIEILKRFEMTIAGSLGVQYIIRNNVLCFIVKLEIYIHVQCFGGAYKCIQDY